MEHERSELAHRSAVRLNFPNSQANWAGPGPTEHAYQWHGLDLEPPLSARVGVSFGYYPARNTNRPPSPTAVDQEDERLVGGDLLEESRSPG